MHNFLAAEQCVQYTLLSVYLRGGVMIDGESPHPSLLKAFFLHIKLVVNSATPLLINNVDFHFLNDIYQPFMFVCCNN